MKRKKHARKRARRKVDITKSLEQLLRQIVPDFTMRLATAEQRAERTEIELTTLKQKLVGLLSKDQLEAAKICGCAPEVYAIECIEIWKEKIFPSFPKGIRPLAGLQENTI